MAKNLEISVLLDFYGQMLTEKQQEVIELYYNEDLSLGEIAQHAQITRQGVRDSIKRAEAVLLHFEERLGLVKRFRDVQDQLEEIVNCAKKIAFEAEKYPQANQVSRHILDNTKKITELANQLSN